MSHQGPWDPLDGLESYVHNSFQNGGYNHTAKFKGDIQIQGAPHN